MSNTYNGMALQRDPNVIDLTAILEANNRGAAARDLRELSAQIAGMERQLELATRKIAAMRRELADLRDFHGEPLHNTASQGIDAATRQLMRAKERLGAVKDSIIQGAKDAVAAVKEKGIGALNSALSFLGVRRELEKLRQDSLAGIDKCDRSITRVDSISRQYHEAGTAARNFGRALMGKEVRDDTKDSGKLAALAASPHLTMKKLHSGLVRGADAVLVRLERLEQSARPSTLENLRAMQETAAKERHTAPSREKKPKEPSL